jgi:hypothetical protein
MLRDGSRCHNQVVVNTFYRQRYFERNSYCLSCICIVRSCTKYLPLCFSKLRTATHSHSHHILHAKTYKTMFYVPRNEANRNHSLRLIDPLRSLLTQYVCVLRMICIISSDSFSVQNWPIRISIESRRCSLRVKAVDMLQTASSSLAFALC